VTGLLRAHRWQVWSAVAVAAFTFPALGFAIGPVFDRGAATWQDVGGYRSSRTPPGVYDFRGLRVGGPPPRPLDRFYTLVRDRHVLLGPRFSVNNELRRFAPRDPGQPLDGIGQYLYPARFSTPPAPPGATP